MKVTDFVSCAASVTSWLNETCPTVPETVAVTGAAESLRACALTVRSADESDGSASAVTTCASRSATGPPRLTVTSRTMPMFRSGGGCNQSIQPIVRSLSGLLGWIRKATVFVPDLTKSVTSSSCRVYAPVTVSLAATCLPSTYTSAAEITPLKSRYVRELVSATVKSERYHQGTAKSAAGIFCWLAE